LFNSLASHLVGPPSACLSQPHHQPAATFFLPIASSFNLNPPSFSNFNKRRSELRNIDDIDDIDIDKSFSAAL
jgi:hypothetical protein